MKETYKVSHYKGKKYRVMKKITTYGSRTSAYDSEPDTETKECVYIGRLADCEAYIRLKESGQLKGK